jgi:hypothetical protein
MNESWPKGTSNAWPQVPQSLLAGTGQADDLDLRALKNDSDRAVRNNSWPGPGSIGSRSTDSREPNPWPTLKNGSNNIWGAVFQIRRPDVVNFYRTSFGWTRFKDAA